MNRLLAIAQENQKTLRRFETTYNRDMRQIRKAISRLEKQRPNAPDILLQVYCSELYCSV